MNTTTLPYKLLTSFHYGVPPLPTHQVVYQTTHYLPTCSVPTYSYSIPRILSIILILFSSLSLPSSLLTTLLWAPYLLWNYFSLRFLRLSPRRCCFRHSRQRTSHRPPSTSYPPVFGLRPGPVSTSASWTHQKLGTDWKRRRNRWIDSRLREQALWIFSIPSFGSSTSFAYPTTLSRNSPCPFLLTRSWGHNSPTIQRLFFLL
jgi:hypothetical protein